MRRKSPIQASFQTDVPAPTLVPTPTSIDVGSLTQVGQFMNVPLTLANYGLIEAQGVTISVSSPPAYQFNILTPDVGTMPAQSTVTVPMTITLVDPLEDTNDFDPCAISLSICFSIPAGYMTSPPA